MCGFEFLTINPDCDVFLQLKITVISGLEFWSALGHFIIGGALLICFKSVRNTLSPPFVIVRDSKELAFIFPTRFKSDVSTNVSREPIAVKFIKSFTDTTEPELFSYANLILQMCFRSLD